MTGLTNTHTTWIFHVDMDAFFVAVETVLNPELKGKPVIVGGDPSGRGVVAAASYEARAYGIHSAMPVSQAKRLCPHAIFIRGHHDCYSKVSKEIEGIFEHFTPFIEMVSIDEAYLNMTGFDRLYGPVIQVAQKIRESIMETTGCPASIGIGTNKLVAKVASNYSKPNGIFLIRPGYECRFFSHLSIKSLPGIGDATAEKLFSLGIHKVGDITRIGEDVLKLTMGKPGVSLFKKAHGLGSEELTPPQLPKSIGNETTFDEDTVDCEFIESVLSYLTEKATTRLRKKSMRARKVTLKLRYSDFHTISRDHTFLFSTDSDREIFPIVIHLFHKAFTRRTRIRLVGVTLSGLVSGPWQLPIPMLHNSLSEKWVSLHQRIDQVREKYGFSSVLLAHSSLNRTKAK